MIVQRYRLTRREPTEAFRSYFEELSKAIYGTLIPAFERAGLVFPQEIYDIRPDLKAR